MKNKQKSNILKEKIKKVFINNKKYIISIITCFILASSYMFIINKLGYGNLSVFHPKTEKNIISLHFYSFLGSIVLTLILFFVTYLIINRKNKKVFIKHFLIYFCLMALILLLIWPGIFKGDEFYTLSFLTNMYEFPYFQHYFTAIFYAVSLSITPMLGGITLLQIFIISIIVAYIMSHIEQELKVNRKIYLLYIILLLPPVIDNNMFPLRSSLISYIFMLMLFHLIFYCKDFKNRRILYAEILASVIVVWKTEFIYLPFIIFIFYILFHKGKIDCKKLVLSSTMIVILIIGLNIPQKQDKDPYILTAVLNPLSVMLKSDNVRESLNEKEISKIENVISIDKLIEFSSYYNIPSYNQIENRTKLTDEEIKEFFKAYISIVLKNPKEFLSARMKTYMATNFSSKTDPANHTENENPSYQWNLLYQNSTYFIDNFKCSKSFLNTDTKKKIISTILLRNTEDYSPNKLNNIFYNVTPPLLIGFVMLLFYWFKKNYKMTMIYLICMAQFVLIFITAPAIFWMYYVVLYINLWFLIMYSLVMHLSEKKTEKK